MALRKADIPDEIYLVETEMKPWVIWILKEGTSQFPKISDGGPHLLD